MTTRLYLRSLTASISTSAASRTKQLSRAGSFAGLVAAIYQTNTIAGPQTPPADTLMIQDVTNGAKVTWISPPIANKVIVNGTTDFGIFNVWGNESANGANACLTGHVLKLNESGTYASTVISLIAARTEMGTGYTAQTWTNTCSTTATFDPTDRIALQLFFDDGAGVTLSASRMVRIYIDGSATAGTADSWISLSNNFVFTNEVKSINHTLDALLAGVKTKSHTTDSYLTAPATPRTLTYTTNSFLMLPLSPRTFNDKDDNAWADTVDTIWQDRASGEKTYTTDSYLTGSQTKTHSSDAYLLRVGSKTHTTDSLHYAIRILTQTLNSYLLSVKTNTHTTGSFILKVDTKSHSVDTKLFLIANKNHTADAFLSGSNQRVHSTDAELLKTQIKTQTADALLAAVRNLVHTLDAVVAALKTKNHTIDAALWKQALKSHTADSYLTQIGRTHTTDAFLEGLSDRAVFESTEGTEFVDTTTHVWDTLIKVHTGDALKYALRIKTHGTSSYLTIYYPYQRVKTHSSDAKLKPIPIYHSTNSVKYGLKTKTHTVSSFLVSRPTKTLTTDALKLAKKTKTYTTGSYLIGTNKIHTTDADLIGASTRTHNTNSYIAFMLPYHRTGVHTSDSYLISTIRHQNTDSLLWKKNELTHSADSYLVPATNIWNPVAGAGNSWSEETNQEGIWKTISSVPSVSWT